jgi:probable phosphoglycerate mutase
MTKFLLIRHGLTDAVGLSITSWLPGVRLNERGQAQAQELAAALSDASIDAVYSSPLERTMETAAPLAERLGLTLKLRDAFGEVRFGAFSGQSLTELEALPAWKAYNVFRSGLRAPDGELMLEVQARFVAELEELRKVHARQTVAVFSHADAIKATIAHYAGAPLDLFHRIEISPASISVLALSEWGPQIFCVNRTAGLPL